METFFSWAASGMGALFIVAVAVAWWEHVARGVRPPAPPPAVPPRVVTVDVALDTLAGPEAPAGLPPTAPAAAGPVGDAALRRAALSGAMTRMAQAPLEASSWTETTPMVLQPPALAAGAAASVAKAEDTVAPQLSSASGA